MLRSLLNALACVLLAFYVCSIFSFFEFPPMLLLAIAVLGHSGEFFFLYSSFDMLTIFSASTPQVFSYGSTPRSLMALAKREKIPFSIIWARIVLAVSGASVVALCSEVLLFFTANGTSVTMGAAVSPVLFFVATDMGWCLLCRGGSFLRFFCDSALGAQALLISWKVDRARKGDASAMITTWQTILVPAFIALFVLALILAKHLSLFYSYRKCAVRPCWVEVVLASAARDTRALNDDQACLAWVQLAGVICLMTFLWTLGVPSKRWITVCSLAGGLALCIGALFAAAHKSAAALEGYAGDASPLPLSQDHATGEWTVPGEPDSPSSPSYAPNICLQPCVHAPCGPECASTATSTERGLRRAFRSLETDSAPLLGPHPSRASYLSIASNEKGNALRSSPLGYTRVASPFSREVSM